MVDNDPRHSPTTDADDEEPETIREMIPKGKENAVDMNDDFWEQILRDRMLDIVEEDPEIHRDGFNIYR